MWKCLKSTFFNWQTSLVSIDTWLHVSLWENDPTSDLIYNLSQQFPFDFMFSVSSFKSSSMQHDVHFVNCGPIYDKVDDNGVNACLNIVTSSSKNQVGADLNAQLDARWLNTCKTNQSKSKTFPPVFFVICVWCLLANISMLTH